nr:hypothetical protein Iba_chr10dCG3060 [Ipomoea batatas]
MWRSKSSNDSRSLGGEEAAAYKWCLKAAQSYFHFSLFQIGSLLQQLLLCCVCLLMDILLILGCTGRTAQDGIWEDESFET